MQSQQDETGSLNTEAAYLHVKRLTAQELANQLNCSLSAVRKWEREGLPSFHIGRLRRYSLEATLRWLENRKS